MSRVRWLAPSPLWDDLAGSPVGFRAPALLRFAGDDFIDRFQAVLERNPQGLRGLVARPETWREPAVGLDAPPPTAATPLRFYQPVHGRFYLVTASLVCRVPGLPEHTVDVASGESVAFVVRRVTVNVSPQTGAETETGEWAWVKRDDGSAGWVSATAHALAADEEQHPLFASNFTGSGALQRRLFAGLVPVSRREAFVAGREMAAAPPPPAPGSLDDPRVIEFQREVLDPWLEMKEHYDAQFEAIEDLADEAIRDTRWRAAVGAAEVASALLLLDLHDFLRDHVAPVWNVARGAAAPGSLAAPAQRTLHDRLADLGVYARTGGGRAPVLAAMLHAAAFRAQLEAPSDPFDPLPGPYTARALVGDPRRPGSAAPGAQMTRDIELLEELLFERDSPPLELDVPAIGVRRLKKLVMDALATLGPAPAVPPEQLPPRQPAATPGDEWFVVRCVYLRPQCGRGAAPLMSERSERFQLTSFFDPDAPARQLRVALPVDTSAATLRKYNRNVAFVLSDQLRKQMSRAASLQNLIDGEPGEEAPGLNFGVICSFSIPIITICALILLMIIVSLLNIVFWWLPFFRICFPAPRPK